MAIFGNLFGKKENAGRGNCCDAPAVEKDACGCNGARGSISAGDVIVVKVLGTGCKKCRQLNENALEAAGRIDDAVRVEYVTDLAEIAAAGVMSTPALLVNGKVVSSGKVLSAEEIEGLLR